MQSRSQRPGPGRHLPGLHGSGASLKRPGFILASAGVALLVVAGIVVSIVVAVDGGVPGGRGTLATNRRVRPQPRR
ncbi:hypothetical protein [Pseudoclavibacter sp. AY1F1]|uniref:hypothetical protein n=1 Tax=Pseudoclavibacter sp. AY1F1 TaxID=2080583 RepID=UPI0011B0E493|nr:hypothetical protein [Pseudoclavibacter sp. AY1F1]